MKQILILIFVISLFSCTNKQGIIANHLNNVKTYLEKNDYSSASREIELAYKLDTKNLEIIFWDAQVKNKAESFDQSISLLNSLIKQKYKIDTVYYLQGKNYFNKALNYYRKGDTLIERVELQNAIYYADSALTINNLYYESYNLKIRSLHNLDNFQDALITINNAILLFPDSTIFLYQRGVEKGQLGDRSGSFNDLTKALQSNKLDSQNIATAYRFRSYIYSAKDSIDKAIDDLTAAINYNPKSDLLYFERGNQYKAKHIKDKACSDYRRAADLGYISVYQEIKTYCEK